MDTRTADHRQILLYRTGTLALFLIAGLLLASCAGALPTATPTRIAASPTGAADATGTVPPTTTPDPTSASTATATPEPSATVPAGTTATPAATKPPTPTPTRTPTAAPTPALRTFTLSELAAYDGKSGHKAYIAVNGTVYDVTGVPEWSGGKHHGQLAGTDLTADFLAVSPHDLAFLADYPVVGTLVG